MQEPNYTLSAEPPQYTEFKPELQLPPPSPGLEIPPVSWWPVALIAGLAFLLYYNAVFNHFYRFGASADASWYAGMLWQGDALLRNPLFIDEQRMSYFTVHSMPVLIPFAYLSHFLPLDHIAYLAVVIALLHAVTCAIAAWCLLSVIQRVWPGRYAALAVFLPMALLFSFGAMQAQFGDLPHPEILLSGLLLAVPAALALGAQRAALIAFVLLMGSREDAGLHLALMLLPLAFLIRLHSGAWPQAELRYALTGIGISVLLFIVLSQVPGAQGMGSRNYLGDPPLAQLNLEEASKRVAYFVEHRAHIYGPMLVLLLAAAWKRSPWLAAGALGVVPWLLLHVFLALPYPTWTLQYYYVFPFLTLLLWPTLLMLYGQGPRRIQPAHGGLWVQGLVLAATLLPVWHSPLPWYKSHHANVDFSATADQLNAEAYRGFQRALMAGRAELGRLAGNYSAIALAPKFFRRNEWLEDFAAKPKEQRERLDTVLFLERPYDCGSLEAVWLDEGFRHRYEVIGTRLVLLSHTHLTGMPSFAQVLSPLPESVRVCSRAGLYR